MAQALVERQVAHLLRESGARTSGEVCLEEISAGDQLTDARHPGHERVSVAVAVPSTTQRLWCGRFGWESFDWVGLQSLRHRGMADGVDAFQVKFFALQVKAQNGVVTGDPEAGHGIRPPGVGRFGPRRGVVTQPAGPVTRAQLSQPGEGVGGLRIARQAAAAVLLQRVRRQGDAPSKFAAIAVQPDEALLSMQAGQNSRDFSRFTPWQSPAQQCHRLAVLQRSGRPASRSAASRIRQLSQTPQG